MQGDGQSPRAEGAGHGMPGVPTLPPGPGQQSEPGAASLGAHGSVSSFQPRHPGSGVRDQPLPPCSILCSWLAAVVVHSLPGRKRSQAPVTLSFCCSSRCQSYSQKEKAPRLPQGTWVESRGSHLLQRQGDAWRGRRAGRHPAVPHPFSRASRASQCPSRGSLLWWEGMWGTITLSGCEQTWRHPGPSG